MIKRKNILKIAIDSPAAAGAGTLAKAISKHYNLLYLDTGKLYRILGLCYLKNDKKINYTKFKNEILKTKFKDLKRKKLLKNEISLAAAYLAKNKRIRSFVEIFQKKIKLDLFIFLQMKFMVMF